MTADPHPGWGYRPAIDGLRTVAVTLVVLFHAGVAGVANGFVGVDLFFVLSGYLVTNVMLAEYRGSGTVRLRRFYARRVRRLLPAAVLLVVVVAAATLLVLPRLTRVSLVADARAALLYVANWHFLGDATDYFAADVHGSPFLHFWSLAIEEQFYVVYPLALLGLLWLGRRLGRPTLVVASGLASLLAVSLLLQVVIARGDALAAYYGTHTRLYQMLAGALLAVTWGAHGGPAVASLRTRLAAPLLRQVSLAGLAAVACLGVLVGVASDIGSLSPSVRGIVACGASVVVIASLEVAPASGLARLLGRPTMTYLGRISYGTYLWHWPVIVLLRAALDVGPWTMAALALVGGTAMAALSFAVLETPVRRSPRLDPWPRVVVAAGLATSLVVAVAVVGPVLRNDTRPALRVREVPVLAGGGDSAAALAADVPAALDLAATEPPEYDYAACSPENVAACVLADHGDVTVLLVGDSNAMVLVPALQELAAEHGFRFAATTQVGCPWQIGLVWVVDDTARRDRCIAARDGWYDAIVPALQPDVVLTVHVPRDPGSRADGSTFAPQDPADDRPLEEVVADATAATVDRLTADGAQVVLFEPMAYAADDPTACLSGAVTVGECAFQANTEPFPTELLYRALAAERADVGVVDMDHIACPYLPLCVPMIDGELVFRNQFHLSNQWLMDHRAALWALIEATGALDAT